MGAVYKGFVVSLTHMGTQEKIPVIKGLDGLAGIEEKMRKAELSQLGPKELKALASKVIPGYKGSDVIDAIVMAERQLPQAEVAVAEMPESEDASDEALVGSYAADEGLDDVEHLEEKGFSVRRNPDAGLDETEDTAEIEEKIAAMRVDKENAGPDATPNAELVLGATERVAATEEKRKETPDEVRERLNARAAAGQKQTAAERKQMLDKVVLEIKNYDNWPSKPETQAFISDPENMRVIKARLEGFERNEAKNSGRGVTDANPFPQPKIVRERKSAGPAAPIEVKAEAPIESAKPESVFGHVLDHGTGEHEPYVPGTPKPAEAAPVVKKEIVAEPVVKVEAPKVEAKKEEPKKVEAIAESAKPEAKAAPEKMFAPIGGGEAAPTMPKVEAKQEVKELDGLVKFNLGKLGILEGRETPEEMAKKIAELRIAAPEFFELKTPAAQLYVIEKLSQKKSHDLDMRAGELQKADKRGWFKRTFDKGYMRREEVRKMKEGGVASYAEDLQGIARFTLDRGKEIEATSEGMMIKFMDVVPGAPNEKLVREFNLAATKLAEIPYNSTMKDLTVMETLQKRKYEKAKKVYDEMRKKVVAFEGKNVPEGEKNSKLQMLSDIDDDIRLNQSLSFNTDVTSSVGQLVRDWKLGDKAIYAAGGALMRGLGKYAFGLCGGALAGGAVVMGAARGWIGKQQEFQKLAEQNRFGGEVKDKKGVKEVISANDFAESINKRVAEIESLPDGPKKDSLIRRLQNRVSLARERDSLGLVNFGKADKQIFGARDAFYSSLKASNRVLLENDPEMKAQAAEVASRMQERLFKDEEKDSERSKAKWSALYRGALTGAGVFAGGFLVRDLIWHDGTATKEGLEWLAKASKNVIGGAKEFAGNVGAFHEALADKAMMGAEKAQNELFGAGTMDKPPLASDLNKPDFHKLAITPEAAAGVGGTSFEQAVGSRGIIGTIGDLQDNVRRVYGNNIPEGLKAFMASKPDRVAIEWGAYRPGEDAESMSVMAGSKIDLMSDGSATLTDSHGNVVRFGSDKITGKFFDAAHGGTAAKGMVIPASTQEFTPVAPMDEAAPVQEFTPVAPMEEGTSMQEASSQNGSSGSVREAMGDGARTSGIPVEGLSLNTPEIKGTMMAQYDDFGRVTRMAWAPGARIEEVRQFMATPDKFLAADLEHSGIKYPTKTLGTPGMLRSFGTSELRKGVVSQDCIEYLKDRAMLRSGQFKAGSAEYTYLTNHMRLLASSIEAKAGGIFRPIQEDGILKGLKAPGIINVPPLPKAEVFTPVSPIKEAVEQKFTPIAPMEGATIEHIDANSKVFELAVDKYGEGKIDGQIAMFDKTGHVGFYSESIDQATAILKGSSLAREHADMVQGSPVQHFATKLKDGTYRVITMYKKAN